MLATAQTLRQGKVLKAKQRGEGNPKKDIKEKTKEKKGRERGREREIRTETFLGSGDSENKMGFD